MSYQHSLYNLTFLLFFLNQSTYLRENFKKEKKNHPTFVSTTHILRPKQISITKGLFSFRIPNYVKHGIILLWPVLLEY